MPGEDVIKETEKIVRPKLPINILAKVKGMRAEVTKAETILRVYMQGVLDAMGLEGDYQLNEATGELTPTKEKEKTQ